MKLLPRAPFVPHARQAYLAVEDRALEHDRLLDIFVKVKDGEPDSDEIDPRKGQLATYTPTMSVLYQTEKEDRMLENLVWAVKLRPTLMRRVKAGYLPRIVPRKFKDLLSTAGWFREWRRVQLSAAEEAGTREKGQQIDLQRFDPDHWWKFGSVLLFGEKISAHLASDSSVKLKEGLLPCGCVPTMDLMRGDQALIGSLCFLFNQLCLMQWLVNLVGEDVLIQDHVPRSDDDCGTHYVIDFTDEKQSNSFTGRLVRHVVMGSEHAHLDENGWPKVWGASEMTWDTGRRTWLGGLRELLVLADVKFLATIDKEMKHDRQWIPTDELKEGKGRANVSSDDERSLAALEEHLMLRYFLTSFQRGQIPVEFLSPPVGALEKPLCRKCRGVATTTQKIIPENCGMSDAFQHQGNDFVDDGYSDEEGKSSEGESEAIKKGKSKATRNEESDLSDEEVDEEDCL